MKTLPVPFPAAGRRPTRRRRSCPPLLPALLSLALGRGALFAGGPSPRPPLRDRIAFEGPVSAQEVWDRVHSLREWLARDEARQADLRALAAQLSDLEESSRFAGAALILLGLPRADKAPRDQARVELRRIARAGLSSELRSAAIELLARRGSPDDIYLVVPPLLEAGERDLEVKIAGYGALREVDERTDLYPLRQLLERPEMSVRADAALALARAGQLDEGVLDLLRQLRVEPGPRGERARLLLEIHTLDSARHTSGKDRVEARLEEALRENQRLRARLEARGSPAGLGSSDALEQLVELLRENYVDPESVNWKELYVEAFRAAVAHMDYHARFVPPSDLSAVPSPSLGHYLGLGARLAKPEEDSPLIVVQPYYNGPVNNPSRPLPERLLSRDRILELDGLPTRDLRVGDVRYILARKRKGDSVRMEVRRGQKRLSLEFRYGVVEMPVSYHELLPGGIGYVRLRRFGPSSAAKFERAISELEAETSELTAFVLDLRGNAGGRLEEAIRVADRFLGPQETRPIVSEAGPAGDEVLDHLPGRPPLVLCPTAVLVDGATASAAEVVAGALQRLGRAQLVGQHTYGKGVAQEFRDAPARVSELVGGPARVLIPTRYLHLWPHARFHTARDENGTPRPGREGGLEPDLPVPRRADTLASWKQKELSRIEQSDVLDGWMRAHERELMITFTPPGDPRPEALLEEPAYSELCGELAAKLDIHLEPREILLAVQRAFRRELEDLRGAPIVDPRDDEQLRRALLWLLESKGLDPRAQPWSAPWADAR